MPESDNREERVPDICGVSVCKIGEENWLNADNLLQFKTSLLGSFKNASSYTYSGNEYIFGTHAT